ncbi:MAG: ERF family protein [Gammaproteobacteria bacterium]
MTDQALDASLKFQAPDNPSITTSSMIHSSMLQVMKGISHLGKDQNNRQQGFKYRGIDDCYNALHGLMADAGVFTTSEILDAKREERTTQKGGVLAFVTLTIQYTFHAMDGSTVQTMVVGEAMDSGDKASNKAMAVAHKYALLQAFLVPTEEQKDPDEETHELQSRAAQEAKANLTDCIEALKIAARIGGKLEFTREWKNWHPDIRGKIAPEEVKKLQSLCAGADAKAAKAGPDVGDGDNMQ